MKSPFEDLTSLGDPDDLEVTTDILVVELEKRRKSDPPSSEGDRVKLLERIILRAVAREDRLRKRILRLEIALAVVILTGTMLEMLLRAGVIHLGK